MTNILFCIGQIWKLLYCIALAFERWNFNYERYSLIAIRICWCLVFQHVFYNHGWLKILAVCRFVIGRSATGLTLYFNFTVSISRYRKSTSSVGSSFKVSSKIHNDGTGFGCFEKDICLHEYGRRICIHGSTIISAFDLCLDFILSCVCNID